MPFPLLLVFIIGYFKSTKKTDSRNYIICAEWFSDEIMINYGDM